MMKITCPRCKTDYQIEALKETAKLECEECNLEFQVNPPAKKPPPIPKESPPAKSLQQNFEKQPQQERKMSGFGFDANAIAAQGRKGDMYIVIQVVLTEKLLGTGSGTTSLTNLQATINNQVARGYRLHTISTTSSGSKGFLGGDKIQATMVFEKVL